MIQHGPLATRFADATARAFAEGTDAFRDLLAEDAVWHNSGMIIAGQDSILQAIGTTMAKLGWNGWDLVDSVETGNSLSMLTRSLFADGRAFDSVAAAQFDRDGKLSVLISLGGAPPK